MARPARRQIWTVPARSPEVDAEGRDPPARQAFGPFRRRCHLGDPGGTIRYLVEEKRHLRHQDVAVIVDQLNRRRADLPAEHAEDRLLLLAPHVRAQQAAAPRARGDRLPRSRRQRSSQRAWSVRSCGGPAATQGADSLPLAARKKAGSRPSWRSSSGPTWSTPPTAPWPKRRTWLSARLRSA